MANIQDSPNTDAPLTIDELAEVRSIVAEIGTHDAARFFNMSREPLARALAALDVRSGTRALIRAGLRRRSTVKT